MPQTLHIVLKPPPDIRLPHDCIHALHRQVFVWLGHVNAPLAAAAHDAGHRPVTVPSELGKRERNFPSFTLSMSNPDISGTLGYDLHLLPDGYHLYAQLCRAMTQIPYVEVDHQPIPLDHAQTKVQDDSSYEAIFTSTQVSHNLQLHFQTPTLFTVKGRDVFQPNPVRIFKGYAERWNAFAPEALAINLSEWEAWLTAYVDIAEMNIRTQTRTWQRSKSSTERHTGFVGWGRFVADAKAPADGLKRWCALADFAKWCGTGRMAAQGLGCTRRM